MSEAWQIIKRIGISNLKLLKLLETWLKEFFRASGKDKLEALYKIASLSSRHARDPLIDSNVIRNISRLLAGATILKEEGLDEYADRLTRAAESYLEALLYKLLPSLERRVLLQEEETEL